MCVWARVLEFPMKFFSEDLLFSVASCICTTLKVDTNTFWAANGKFARFCIEVDCTKHVLTKVMVDDLLFSIEYENMSAICFNCGKIGHKLDSCPFKIVNPPASAVESHEPRQVPSYKKDIDLNHIKSETFGPWFLVNQRIRRTNLDHGPTRRRGKQFTHNIDKGKQAVNFNHLTGSGHAPPSGLSPNSGPRRDRNHVTLSQPLPRGNTFVKSTDTSKVIEKNIVSFNKPNHTSEPQLCAPVSQRQLLTAQTPNLMHATHVIHLTPEAHQLAINNT